MKIYILVRNFGDEYTYDEDAYLGYSPDRQEVQSKMDFLNQKMADCGFVNSGDYVWHWPEGISSEGHSMMTSAIRVHIPDFKMDHQSRYYILEVDHLV